MKKYTYKFLFMMLCLIMIFSTIYAGREFDIAPYRQWGTNTCWAAVSVMLMNILKQMKKKVRCWAYPIPNESNCDCSMNGQTDLVNYLYGKNKSVEDILSHFGSIGGQPSQPLAQEEISEEINDGIKIGRPFICGLSNGTKKHMVLAIGYGGSGGSDVSSVIFNDPATNQRRELSYRNFMVNDNYLWLETFLLTTDPRNKIPTGIRDYCRINNGGTTTITQSTTSLTYSAIFHAVETPPAHPVSWTWKLIFIHANGKVVANSWISSSNTSQLTWNISGFTLPSGYQWYYNFNGNILGRVELDLLESDGYHHYDAIDVQFIPNNRYPGNIVYAGNTVSSTQPEVKAHQTITVENDQFLSGGNINFRAGESISISDGVTVQNGNTVHFIIDGSVK